MNILFGEAYKLRFVQVDPASKNEIPVDEDDRTAAVVELNDEFRTREMGAVAAFLSPDDVYLCVDGRRDNTCTKVRKAEEELERLDELGEREFDVDKALKHIEKLLHNKQPVLVDLNQAAQVLSDDLMETIRKARQEKVDDIPVRFDAQNVPVTASLGERLERVPKAFRTNSVRVWRILNMDEIKQKLDELA